MLSRLALDIILNDIPTNRSITHYRDGVDGAATGTLRRAVLLT
jgi:hypothetical protein